jgi:nucleoside-diphosphate-sugar epimerase
MCPRTRSTVPWRRMTRAFTRRSSTSRTRPTRRARRASDHLVRAYHHTYGLQVTTSNCSNNYGPFHFPKSSFPCASPTFCAVAPAGLRRRQQHPRLAVRGGSLPRYRARARSRRRSVRATTSAATTSGTTWRSWNSSAPASMRALPLTRRSPALPDAPPARGDTAATLIEFVDGSRRPRLALCHRCQRITRELGYAPAGDLRDRYRENPRLVSRQRGLVAAAAEPRLAPEPPDQRSSGAILESQARRVLR